MIFRIGQLEIDEIRSARIRRRHLFIPVRYGEFGERKRCSLKAQQVVTLKPRVPYEQHKTTAQAEPTRARAVLMLMELCEARGREVTVTITDVQLVNEQSAVYAIRFEKGEHRGEQPRLLAAWGSEWKGDYASTPSRAVKGEGEAVEEKPLERYAAYARECHAGIMAEQRIRLLKAVQSIRVESARQNAGSFSARKRLKSVERELRVRQSA